MKTQVKKELVFNKNIVTELNDNALRNINGGTDGLTENGDGDVTRWTSELCKSGIKEIISK